jgi:hypothetical protein
MTTQRQRQRQTWRSRRAAAACTPSRPHRCARGAAQREQHAMRVTMKGTRRPRWQRSLKGWARAKAMRKCAGSCDEHPNRQHLAATRVASRVARSTCRRHPVPIANSQPPSAPGTAFVRRATAVRQEWPMPRPEPRRVAFRRGPYRLTEACCARLNPSDTLGPARTRALPAGPSQSALIF